MEIRLGNYLPTVAEVSRLGGVFVLAGRREI
jgi:hypothetical protein